jgi:hypothetical protein
MPISLKSEERPPANNIRAHRFEPFSPDFAVWVFFYGPEGGEVEP